jgi:hypothetical protein
LGLKGVLLRRAARRFEGRGARGRSHAFGV